MLIERLDGELTRGEQEEVDRHLETCADCRRELAEMRLALEEFAASRESLLASPDAQPPKPWGDIRSRMRPAPMPMRRLIWLAAAATVGLLVYGAIRLRPNPAAPLPEPKAEQPKVLPVAPSEKAVERPPQTPASPASNLSLELQVFAMLHGLHADTGEQVEVDAAAPGGIVVSAVGLNAERREQIRTALAKLPRVELKFEDAPGKDLPPAPAGKPASPPRSPLHERLVAYFGSADALDQFGADFLESTGEMLARAHTLDVLVERFPAATVAQFSDAERSELASIRADHVSAIAAAAGVLAGQWKPVVEALGLSTSEDAVAGGRLTLCRRSDQLANQILTFGGVHPSERSPAELYGLLHELGRRGGDR